MALLLLFRCGAARADPLRVHIDPCTETSTAAVQNRLHIELQGERAALEKMAAVQVEASCGASGIDLCVFLAGSPRRCRVLSLSGAPRGLRPRLLGLHAAELIEDHLGEAAGPAARPVPVPAPHPAIPSGGAPAPRAGLRSGHALEIAGAGTVAWFSGGTPILWGGQVRLSGDARRHMGWSLEALGSGGSGSFAAGTVAIEMLGVGCGVNLWHQIWRIRLRLGAGVRSGVVRLFGRPADPALYEGRVAFAPWAEGRLQVSVGLLLGPKVRAQMGGGVGYVFVPAGARVDGQTAVQVGGIGLELGLGLGVPL